MLKINHLTLLLCWCLPLLSANALEKLSTKKPVKKGRYIRIELPQNKKEALTLNEVEVRVGGENIAPNGKAKQSSTSYEGIAYRAIDGRKDPFYTLDGNPGQTHTTHGEGNWWELDLGSEFTIDEIEIWNREQQFAYRLNGFTLKVLDNRRKQVYGKFGSAAPDGSVLFSFREGKLHYRDHEGKENQPLPWTPEKKGQPVPDGYKDPAPFAFQKDDTVAIIGNGLADRMQHEGWVEALLQKEYKDLNLSFRNMSVSGDRVNHYPRSMGFTEMDKYLQHVKADVIFCFFGYNESFGKEEKVGAFRNELKKMVQTLRAARPNGKSIPRIVLFSPIPHENLKDLNLPSGEENNVNLKLYTEEMSQAAQEVGVSFIDLFTPLEKVSAPSPLTINGVHLNNEGYRTLSEIITQAVSGNAATASREDKSLEEIREAVLDKNWHWHNRYRATDGNDIWGSRGQLSFVNKQSNNEVLTHELVMLDQMTANRDQKIWATARGEDYTINDTNVPAPLEVISNVGTRGDSGAKEGDGLYQDAIDAIDKMKVPEGFQVNLFADESRFPQLANPVQMQVDTQGRLWAAAWKTYPKWEPLTVMDDALLVFHDDDKDGQADRCIEFAKVHNPVGFEFWNGGVIVTCQPDILFLKDTDGDDVADVRQVLLQGIGSADTHHAANNLHYGPDGGIYWQSGYFLVNNIEHPWGPSLQTGASGVYRFDPRRYTISFQAGGYSPNPHGVSFDYWGYQYAQDGTGGKGAQVRRDPKGFKSASLFERQVRPVTSCAILSSMNFPEQFQQNYLLANVIGFLGIKNYALHREGFPEKDYGFGEVWGTPEEDLLVSSDKNFRPTDMKIGEDGALYFSDWHNVIIGHMQHNIRDPKRDRSHGRIYRMVYTEKPLQEAVKINDASVSQLLENLKHPVDGVRHRSRVELSERSTEEVMSALTEWTSQFQATQKKDAHHLLEALWVHQQHNVRNDDLLNALLNSPEPHAVEAAKTVKHHWTVADPVKNKSSQVYIQPKTAKDKVTVPQHLKHEEKELFKLGAKVYEREAHCATCHQNDGEGIGLIYPPLNKSNWVTESPERLIKLTLHGLWGKLEVNGKVYDPEKGVPPMTAFHSILDDTEVAAVLTYVRNSWGNKSSAIYPDTVKKVRAESKGRNTFWQVDELLKAHPIKE